MRRGTPSDCHTDSNTSTTGGNNQIQAQQQTQPASLPPAQQTQSQQQPANTQITTHPTYGEDDSSCDSQFLGKFASAFRQSNRGSTRVHIRAAEIEHFVPLATLYFTQ